MRVNLSNISFQKRLAADCAIINADDKEKEQCSIYRILPDEDKGYFKLLKYDKNWQNANYLDLAIWELPNLEYDVRCEFYSMEDSNGSCVGFAEIGKYGPNLQIINIEAAPAFANKKSKYNYIGETLLSFATKIAQGMHKPYLVVKPSDKAVGFYKKCQMDYNDDKALCTLPESKFDTLLEQNQLHTGSSIDMMV